MHRRSWFLAIPVALALCASRVAWTDPADDAFARGQKLAKSGALPEAEKEFEAAWAARKSWDIAGNLGLTEAALGRWDEAATHLDYALRHIGGLAKPEQRKALEDRFAEAKTHVAAVTVNAPAGAAISVDGKPVGVGPLEAPVFLSPGDHTVEARLASSADGLGITVVAGEKKAVTLTPAGGALPTATASGSGSPPEPRSAAPAVVFGGFAAAGFAIGIGFTVSGVLAESGVEGTTCPGGPETCPQEAQDDIDRRNAFIPAGIAGFTVGAAALGAMIAYLAWPNPPSSASATVRVVPAAGPTGAGLTITGGF